MSRGIMGIVLKGGTIVGIGVAAWYLTPLGPVVLRHRLLGKWKELAKEENKELDTDYLKIQLNKLKLKDLGLLIQLTKIGLSVKVTGKLTSDQKEWLNENLPRVKSWRSTKSIYLEELEGLILPS